MFNPLVNWVGFCLAVSEPLRLVCLIARPFSCVPPSSVPSIRTDIPKYERRSIADSQNYGDDVNASYLLHPSQFASQGVEDEEFEKPRDKVGKHCSCSKRN